MPTYFVDAIVDTSKIPVKPGLIRFDGQPS